MFFVWLTLSLYYQNLKLASFAMSKKQYQHSYLTVHLNFVEIINISYDQRNVSFNVRDIVFEIIDH